MLLLIALHFALAALAPALTRMLDRSAFHLLALAPAAAFCWLVPQVAHVTSTGRTLHWRLGWVQPIGLDLDLALTPLAGILTLLVTGIGALVLVYCAWYFRPGDPDLWRFGSVLTAFAGSMLALVVSDNLFVLYTAWELTTVLSFLLIGHNPERRANRRAAMTALLVTTFGGLAMLIGLVLLAHESGHTTLTAILADPPSGPAVTVAVLLTAVGALSKSALVPFHFWLPGAMAAPTPVSAYLHAAAMVKAGVFLVALLAPTFADTPGWRPVMVTLGLTTMLLGGLRALRQYDIKLLLAYGTVSQLGFLVAMAGTGTRAAGFAAVSLVCAHALFKSALFLVVGVIDRSAGTRDLRKLSGLWRRRPVLAAAAILSAASMAGVPPLFGFTAKESALAAYLDLHHDLGWNVAAVAALAAIVVGSVLTVGYTARFVWGAFADKPDTEPTVLTRFAPGFTAVPVAITLLTVTAGFAGSALTPRIARYADLFTAGAHHPELTLWHGWSPALGLSALCIAGGIGLFLARHPVAAGQQRIVDAFTRWHLLPDAERGYQAVLRGVDRLSVEVTSRTQRGSLPVYAGIILVVLVLAPGSAVVAAWHAPQVRFADNLLQPACGSVIVVAAVLTARSRRRLRAVLLAGITGYGTALLFIAHGAPDLALTQVLVETFMLVTFVLVLRRLPPYFSDRPFALSRWVRITIGVATGLVVAGIAVVASNARTAAPISERFAKPAYEYGGGHNIVNVTLVDIRAWDTLGELSVLVVAATGIASLIFLITDRGARRTRSPQPAETVPWLAASLRPERRSIVFEIVTRLIFHTVIVFSVYLMLAGHNAPGGGFAGGLIAGLALTIRYLAGGRAELDNAAPIDAGVVLGTGLAVAALSGLVPTLVGGGVLQSAIVDIHLPLLGTLHVVTSVFFDIGVYLVVVGLALDVLRSLGAGIDAQSHGPGLESAHGEVTT